MRGIVADNGKIARNTLFLYVRLFFVLVISLYISRAVLDILGVSDFGVYNVVSGFVSIFGFLNATLSSSMSRYYNYEGARSGSEGISRVFASGMMIHLILAASVMVILGTFGMWYMNNELVVPQESLLPAKEVFLYSCFSLVLVIMQTPFTSAILSSEKMDFYALVSIVDILLKLLAVIALPYIGRDKLSVYAFLLLTISAVDFLIYAFYAMAKIPGIAFRSGIDRKILRSMTSFSLWNLTGTFAYMLKGQGTNLLLNSFFGTVVNAARGLASQVLGAVSNFSGVITTSFNPQMVDAYSKQDKQRALQLFLTESKIACSLMLILAVPIILETDYLLGLWLGDNIPENTSVFIKLVLADVLICSLNTPVTQLAMATGKIKTYQICSSAVNLLLLPVCWLVLKCGAGPQSAFIVAIPFSILNQTVCLICLKKVFPLRLGHYFKAVVLPLAAVAVLLPTIPVLVGSVMDPSFLRLCAVAVSDVIMAVLLVYLIVLDYDERIILKSLICRKSQ